MARVARLSKTAINKITKSANDKQDARRKAGAIRTSQARATAARTRKKGHAHAVASERRNKGLTLAQRMAKEKARHAKEKRRRLARAKIKLADHFKVRK